MISTFQCINVQSLLPFDMISDICFEYICITTKCHISGLNFAYCQNVTHSFPSERQDWKGKCQIEPKNIIIFYLNGNVTKVCNCLNAVCYFM